MKVNERVVRHRFEYQASEKVRKFVRLVRAWPPMFRADSVLKMNSKKIRELAELAMVAVARLPVTDSLKGFANVACGAAQIRVASQSRQTSIAKP